MKHPEHHHSMPTPVELLNHLVNFHWQTGRDPVPPWDIKDLRELHAGYHEPQVPDPQSLFDRLSREQDVAARHMNQLNPTGRPEDVPDWDAFSAWSHRVMELHLALAALDPERAQADNARRKGM